MKIIAIILLAATNAIAGFHSWTVMERDDKRYLHVSYRTTKGRVSVACKIGEKDWIGPYFTPKIPFAKDAEKVNIKIDEDGGGISDPIGNPTSRTTVVLPSLLWWMTRLGDDSTATLEYYTEPEEYSFHRENQLVQFSFPFRGLKDALSSASMRCMSSANSTAANWPPDKWHTWQDDQGLWHAGMNNGNGAQLSIICRPDKPGKWIAMTYNPPKPISREHAAKSVEMRFSSDQQFYAYSVWITNDAVGVRSKLDRVVKRFKQDRGVAIRYRYGETIDLVESRFYFDGGATEAVEDIEQKCEIHWVEPSEMITQTKSDDKRQQERTDDTSGTIIQTKLDGKLWETMTDDRGVKHAIGYGSEAGVSVSCRPGKGEWMMVQFVPGVRVSLTDSAKEIEVWFDAGSRRTIPVERIETDVTNLGAVFAGVNLEPLIRDLQTKETIEFQYRYAYSEQPAHRIVPLIGSAAAIDATAVACGLKPTSKPAPKKTTVTSNRESPNCISKEYAKGCSSSLVISDLGIFGSKLYIGGGVCSGNIPLGKSMPQAWQRVAKDYMVNNEILFRRVLQLIGACR